MARVPLPETDEYGHLPPGVHTATIEEVERLYGVFQRSDCRPALLRKLKEYLGEVRQAGWKAEVIIDGSFVMKKVDEPDDIDIILVMPPGWDMAADLQPFEYNLMSKRQVRRRFGFDVFPVRHGSPEYARWTDFFIQVNPKWNERFGFPLGLQKGIVRIV